MKLGPSSEGPFNLPKVDDALQLPAVSASPICHRQQQVVRKIISSRLRHFFTPFVVLRGTRIEFEVNELNPPERARPPKLCSKLVGRALMPGAEVLGTRTRRGSR